MTLHLAIGLCFVLGNSPGFLNSDITREFESTARTYRMEVYDHFRLDRPEYNRHQELGWEAVRRWRDAKRDPDLRDQLLNWLVTSTDAVRTNRAGDLRPLPGGPFVPQTVSSTSPDDTAVSDEPERRTGSRSSAADARITGGTGDSSTVKILSSIGRALVRTATRQGPRTVNVQHLPLGKRPNPGASTTNSPRLESVEDNSLNQWQTLENQRSEPNEVPMATTTAPVKETTAESPLAGFEKDTPDFSENDLETSAESSN